MVCGIKKYLVILLLLLSACSTNVESSQKVLASPVAFSSYYVTTSGIDTNPCTLTLPCKTFSRAQNLANTGDAIELVGTFAPITITKAGIVVSGGVIDGTLSNQSRCVEIKADDVTVDGVRVENCKSHAIISYNKNSVIKNSTVVNSVLEGKGTNGPWGSCIKGERGSENLTIEGNTVEDCYGEGIAVTMVRGAIVVNNYVRNAHSTLYYIDNSSSVLFENNTGICTGDSGFTLSGSRPSGLAVGEETYSGWGSQLRDVTIRNNFLDGCSTGIFIFASDTKGTTTNLLIENNIIPSGQDFAISLDNGKCLNVAIRNNSIWKLNIWTRCSTGKVVSGNYLYNVAVTPATFTPTIPTTNTKIVTPVPASPTYTPTRTVTASPPTATRTNTPTPTIVTPTFTVAPVIIRVNGTPIICPCNIIIP